MHRAQPHAEAQILAVTQRTLNSPATAIEAGQLFGSGIGATGGETPGLLHLRILHADHGSHPVAVGGNLGAAQHTCASAGLYPVSRRPGLPRGAGHGDVATEANDVVET